ncbi:MAG TPA: DUF6266 family protein [Puia sp.]|jgi:hypothetical protein|nr:DUF6266 family protein [Puia sp.]
MGTIEQGFLGGFNGKLGTAVGSKWKGINVIRSRPPRKRKGQPSESQLEVQAKFTLMTNFLRPLADLLDQTFKKTAVGMTGVNKAFAENKRAVTGTAPNFTVDYPKVFLSTGSLPGIMSPVLTSPTAGKLQLTWTDNSGKKKALSSDLLFVAAYSQDLDEWEFVEDAAPRNAGTFTMDLTEFSGKTVQTYVGVFTADGKTVSDSQFTGAVAIL